MLDDIDGDNKSRNDVEEWSQNPRSLHALENSWWERTKQNVVDTGNWVGEAWVQIRAVEVVHLIWKDLDVAEQMDQLCLLLALRRYANDHGKLPDALIDLEPTYLDAVPLRGDQPFLYNKESRSVYLPGPDGFDDGGLDERDEIFFSMSEWEIGSR